MKAFTRQRWVDLATVQDVADELYRWVQWQRDISDAIMFRPTPCDVVDLAWRREPTIEHKALGSRRREWWQPAWIVLSQRHGDCEDLAAYFVLDKWLNERDFSWRPGVVVSPSNSGAMHCIAVNVERDGKYHLPVYVEGFERPLSGVLVEDPSYRWGMPIGGRHAPGLKPGQAYFPDGSGTPYDLDIYNKGPWEYAARKLV